MKNCILATFVGAIIVFIWTSVSWMVLPWHNWDMKSFKDDGKHITEALKKEASESGIYVIPNLKQEDHQDSKGQEAWMEKAHQGPFAYMSVRTQGTHWDMNVSLAVQFLMQLFVASLVVSIISKMPTLTVLGKAFTISLIVTTGTLISNISCWNWWGFPVTTTLVNIADVAIGWFLAGIFIALIKRSKVTTNNLNFK